MFLKIGRTVINEKAIQWIRFHPEGTATVMFDVSSDLMDRMLQFSGKEAAALRHYFDVAAPEPQEEKPKLVVM